MITPDLRNDIDALVTAFEEACGPEDQPPDYVLTAMTLLKRAGASEPVLAFKVGDRVRRKASGEYLGTVSNATVFYAVRDRDNDLVGEFVAEALEIAPELDQQTVWSEVPLLIMRQINLYKHAGVLLESYARTIRHECYRLLGGCGVKIGRGDNDPVRQRVRQLVIQVAAGMGVEIE